MSSIFLKDFPDDLHRKAKSEAALMGISLKEFIIKADQDVKYDRIDAVLDALKQAKVKVIFLLSNQETVE